MCRWGRAFTEVRVRDGYGAGEGVAGPAARSLRAARQPAPWSLRKPHAYELTTRPDSRGTAPGAGFGRSMGANPARGWGRPRGRLGHSLTGAVTAANNGAA